MSLQLSRIASPRVASAALALVSLASIPSAARAVQSPVPAATASDAGAKELAALQTRYQAAERAFFTKLDAAGEDPKAIAEVQKEDPRPAFVKEFAALAARTKGTETAASALSSVLQIGTSVANSPEKLPPECGPAFDTLVRDHANSPAVRQLVENLRWSAGLLGTERVINGLRQILDGAKDQELEANAQLTLAVLLMEREEAAKNQEAHELLVELRDDFPGIADSQGREVSALATGHLFELEHLQIGMVAPDFEATDENGVKWKLSEYRGKVAVVDFWGFW